MGLFTKSEEKAEKILESWSPYCNINAFVEKSKTCYYFYLWIDPLSDHPTVKACWICNRVKSPVNLDLDRMKRGTAPMMPAQYVGHHKNGIDLDEKKLSIAWFPEGDAAALLSGDELLCVLRGWKDVRFPGYCRYAVGRGPYAWEMNQNAADNFMAGVRLGEKNYGFLQGKYWYSVLCEHIEVLKGFFGEHEQCVEVTKGRPSRAVILGARDSTAYAVTAGVSLIPMPRVVLEFEDKVNENRRIEYGFACDERNKALRELMLSTMKTLADAPWKRINYYAHGHMVQFGGIKGYHGFLFINPKNVIALESPEYKPFMGDKVNLLWIVPVRKEEFDIVVESGVDELLKHAIDISRVHIFDGQKKFDI